MTALQSASLASEVDDGVGTGNPPRVVGLDLSLTCTGIAGNGWTETIRPPAKLRGHDRLQHILVTVADYTRSAALVVVEGPSYGNQSRQQGHHERAGLWWLVTHRLWATEIPFAVVPPASVKRYATGRGNADKAAMVLAVARRFAWFDGGEDEADALVLAAMGADRLGCPFAGMPAAHRAALDAVDWPAVVS